MISPNSFYYHALVLASQCAGLVYSGANAAYAPDELAHQLSDSGAKLVRSSSFSFFLLLPLPSLAHPRYRRLSLRLSLTYCSGVKA